ncbi:hypothetical protein [Polaromonas sp. CG_9.11]|uniref:hypothetical protein n=1 Tax=Polaromonas sp. CG_9.11 TaxID=2787730 RepID=UPI0018CA33A9|nr:hypothetical protein [Polaromonas sp. CG_9.11]MBG6076514.1 hypothetical protein [Polaromonas sp. CG_9.11]
MEIGWMRVLTWKCQEEKKKNLNIRAPPAAMALKKEAKFFGKNREGTTGQGG